MSTDDSEDICWLSRAFFFVELLVLLFELTEVAAPLFVYLCALSP